MTLNHATYFAPAAAEKSNGNGSISREKGSTPERANGGSPEPHIQKQPAADHVARLHVVPAAAPEQRRSPEKVSGNQSHQNIVSAGGADLKFAYEVCPIRRNVIKVTSGGQSSPP